MLNIFNNLKPFFEDCYRELGVREYSRIVGISPPTASKLLKEYEKEGLVNKRKERGFLLFRANRESNVLKSLSRIYWEQKLRPLIEFINEELYNSPIVLFGSLTKLEVNENSDIDLVVFTKIKKEVDLRKFEDKYRREIQIFKFENFSYR